MPNFPIVCNNVEVTATIVSNSLSDIWFKLVDANLQPVKLLCPLYISGVGVGVGEYVEVQNKNQE
jgi:hypothetical protein